MNLVEWFWSHARLLRALEYQKDRARAAEERASRAEAAAAQVLCPMGHLHVNLAQAAICNHRSPEDMARIRALTEGEA